MDDTSRYRLGDIYMTSALSVIFVAAFVYLKSHEPRSKQRLLQLLLGGWALLEITALVLSSVRDFSNKELPRAISRSVHLVLVTFSMCGLVNVQVSANFRLALALC
jgi:hypothetical protein